MWAAWDLRPLFEPLVCFRIRCLVILKEGSGKKHYDLLEVAVKVFFLWQSIQTEIKEVIRKEGNLK